MWTLIVVVMAFCLGFLVASLLACAKAADVELSRMPRNEAVPESRFREAQGGLPGSQRIHQTGLARMLECCSDEATIHPGRCPALENNRRVETT